MSVTFQWQAVGSPTPSTSATFTDVPDSNAVSWAVENGITNGTGNNKFSPEQICTRAQIVTFLYRELA